MSNYKLMQIGKNGKLYYATNDGVNDLLEDLEKENQTLELGDRIYITDLDIMLYSNSSGNLYDQSGNSFNDETSSGSLPV